MKSVRLEFKRTNSHPGVNHCFVAQMEIFCDNLEMITIEKMESRNKEIIIGSKDGRPVFEQAIGFPFLSDKIVCKDGEMIVGAGDNSSRVRHKVR